MTVTNADHSARIPGLLTQVLSCESLFTRLEAGHTLVTANSRLSRVLSAQFDQWCINRGQHQWQSPEIFNWNHWLDKFWETAGLHGISGTEHAVPGERQLISLWEHTLKNEPLKHHLLHPESLAKQLRETRELIVKWQLNFKDPAWFDNDNENHAAFYHWNRAFEKRCIKGNWLCPEDRTGILCRAIENDQLSTSKTIDLLGFDEFNPDQAALLLALLQAGTPVNHLAFTPRQDKAVLWKGRDSKDELERMARWVRYWHEKEPGSAIAVVVPDLKARRTEVERHLEEILAPGHTRTSALEKPWNISMGTPLAGVPMIETAFDLLRLLDQRIEIQVVGRLLRSPWLRGARTERNSRALLEKCLRNKYPRQLKPHELLYRASEFKAHDRYGAALPEDQHEPRTWNSPEFARILGTLKHFAAENNTSRPASAWAESLDRLLFKLGWPLADTQFEEHGENWQVLQRWREALRELASLDATTPQMGRKAAINQLMKICREEIYQPRTAAASIQVLGLYEISGLRFDHLWVLGLHNDCWPTRARPNPFIPGKLQKTAQLPHSSPQRELEVARTITRRLLQTAPDCVFSYPGQLEGEDVLPSPLLDSHEIAVTEDIPAWQGDSWRGVVASAEKPRITPLQLPGKMQHDTAKGGSSILKHQALCPFRAFASNRLGADGLETPVDGISPMLHGSLVHRALECFWKETRNRSALVKLDDVALTRRVQKHVDAVTGEDRGLKQRPAFRIVEANRVHRHVMEYLQLEKERDDFEVTGFEKEILTKIEGQTIRLVIDRVDRLPSGDEIIIDYKTGKVEPKKWFGDRPEEPQLPLYAITAPKVPSALAFGIIRDDGCLFKGVVTRAGLLPGLPKRGQANQELIDAGNDMPATIENWRRVLHQLMADFLAGEAAVDPKAGLETCKKSYCELQSLCRIGELRQRGKSAQPTDREEAGA